MSRASTHSRHALRPSALMIIVCAGAYYCSRHPSLHPGTRRCVSAPFVPPSVSATTHRCVPAPIVRTVAHRCKQTPIIYVGTCRCAQTSVVHPAPQIPLCAQASHPGAQPPLLSPVPRHSVPIHPIHVRYQSLTLHAPATYELRKAHTQVRTPNIKHLLHIRIPLQQAQSCIPSSTHNLQLLIPSV